MNLIYQHKVPQFGSIWQSGYREFPHDLTSVNIHLVIYAASECPPLNHHQGAKLEYCPNDDSLVPIGSEYYQALLDNAKVAVPFVVNAVKGGDNVLVTCNMGINRSSLVTGLALVKLGLKPSEAIDLIRNNRPGTLTNNIFEHMIQDSSR